MTGTIFRIARFSVHDGPGIRTTVFLKGCPLRCRWCHSPESQNAAPQLALHDDRCLVCGTCLPNCDQGAIAEANGRFATDFSRCRACGACVARCPSGAREIVGRLVSCDDLVREIERDVVFFDESGGGVTFSGGEPLMQADFLESMLVACRDRGLHVAVDTCGMAEPRTAERVLPLADLVLFDVKVVDEARHRRATGGSNATILANLRALAARRAEVRIRFPLVPALTADDENVRAVGQLLASLGLVRVDVLPCHRAGLAKYERIGQDVVANAVEVPTQAQVDAAVSTLSSFGLEVRVGG